MFKEGKRNISIGFSAGANSSAEFFVTSGPRRMHGSSFNLSSKFLFQYRQIQRARCIHENADATATQEFQSVCVVPQRTPSCCCNEPFRTLASSILRVSWHLPCVNYAHVEIKIIFLLFLHFNIVPVSRFKEIEEDRNFLTSSIFERNVIYTYYIQATFFQKCIYEKISNCFTSM